MVENFGEAQRRRSQRVEAIVEGWAQQSGACWATACDKWWTMVACRIERRLERTMRLLYLSFAIVISIWSFVIWRLKIELVFTCPV